MLINPKLPKHFFTRDNSLRSPLEIKKFWDKPIILTDNNFYKVYCLDGKAWDRPSLWGGFDTLEEASACCANGPVWRK